MPKSIGDKATFNVVTIVFALLFAVAIFLLHLLHKEHDSARTQQTETIAQTQRLLGETESKLQGSLATEASLRDDISSLKNEYQTAVDDLSQKRAAENQAWEQKLTNANQSIQNLDHDIKVLTQESADALAAEQQSSADALAAEQQSSADALAAAQNQAAQVLADTQHQHAQEMEQAQQAYNTLDGRFNDANTKIAELGNDINDLLSQIEEGNAQHAADVENLQGRIEAYRVTLEGEYPERAAQLIKLEQHIQNTETALRNAQADHRDVEAGLNAELAIAAQIIAERDESLANAVATILDREQSLAQTSATLEETGNTLAQTQAELDTTIQQANDTIASMQAEHAAQVEQFTQAINTTEAELAQTQATLRQTIDTANATQASLQGELENLHAAFETHKVETTAQIESMTATQLATEDALATTRTELSTAIEQGEAVQAQLQGALDNLQAEYATNKAENEASIADLIGRLEVTETQLGSTQTDLAATIERTDAERARMEGEIAGLQNALATEKADNKLIIENVWATHAAIESELNAKLQQADQQLTRTQQLHKSYAELGGRHTDRGMLVTLADADLQFAGGSTVLPEGELESLVSVANVLNTHQDLNILLEGHTDSAGGEELNLALSEKRAAAVKEALVGLGVNAERIETVGIGEARPIASNATYDGRRQNRRVEVYLSSQ